LFWWAEGHEALDQEWVLGDFSTWIDRNIHWQAYGVEFELDGLKRLLAPERAALLARELSVASSQDWITAMEARKHLYMSNFTSPTSADRVLIDQCALGLVAAKALKAEMTFSDRHGTKTRTETEWDIPVWFWSEFTKSGSSSQDWNRGVFRGIGSGPEGRCDIKLTGVYVCKDTLPNSEAEPSATAAPVNVGKGRPAKAFWDELWNEIWGSIYRGDFEPKTQTEIEQAMLNWISENGHDAGESTIRPLARRMILELGKK